MGKEYTRSFTTVGLVPLLGSVILHDNFENLTRFIKTGTGGDDIFELDPSISYNGSQSLNMKTRVTGASTSDYISTKILTHLLPSKRLTFSIRFLSPDFTKIQQFYFYFLFYDGVNINSAEIIFFPNTPIFQYRGDDNALHNIPNSGFNLIDDAWHALTLEIDFLNSKYISFSVDHLFFNLSDLSLHTGTDATLMHLSTEIYLNTVGNAPAQVRLDELSFTEI